MATWSEHELKRVRRQHGKKYAGSIVKLAKEKKYSVEEAFDLLPELAFAKFDETVEIVLNLGIDPKKSDQMVRGAVVLPHGTGKSARILVIAKGDKAKEAEGAGADYVGAEDLIDRVAAGWFDFEKVIATPDMMAPLAKIGKLLGPRGLMPNPKLGTVTLDVVKAVQEQKKGKVEYRSDKGGVVHVAIGKKSFGSKKLKENFGALMQMVLKAKPPTSKGTYIKKLTVSTTMSPGVPVDVSSAIASAGEQA